MIALRKRAATAAIVVGAVLIGGVPPAAAGVSGAYSNHVSAFNKVDGADRTRARVSVSETMGPRVSNQNTALAYASCTDCRTVAVAVQVVVVEGSADNWLPYNAAVAVNHECLRCQTFAYARQEIISPGTPVQFSSDARERMAALGDRIREVAASDETFTTMMNSLDALTDELVNMVTTEIERSGTDTGRRGERKVDQRDT